MAKLRNVFSILKRVINCSICGILVRLWLCKCSFFLAYLPFWPASMTLSCISIRLNPVLWKLLVRNVTVERRILIKLCDLLRLTFSDRTFRYGFLILVTTNLGRSVRYSLRVWRPLFYMLGWESVLSLPLLILLLLLTAWLRIWLLRGVVSQVIIYRDPLQLMLLFMSASLSTTGCKLDQLVFANTLVIVQLLEMNALLLRFADIFLLVQRKRLEAWWAWFFLAKSLNLILLVPLGLDLCCGVVLLL